jgi:hypothetical protein
MVVPDGAERFVGGSTEGDVVDVPARCAGSIVRDHAIDGCSVGDRPGRPSRSALEQLSSAEEAASAVDEVHQEEPVRVPEAARGTS